MGINSKTRLLLRKNYAAKQGTYSRWKQIVANYLRYGKNAFGIKTMLTKIFRSTAYDYQLNTAFPCQISTRLNDWTHNVAVEEVFSQNIYQFKEVPKDVDLIIDLGANIGCFTLAANAHFPTQEKICVEPDLDNFNLLRKNLKKNNVPAILHNVAVSGFDGYGQLAGTSSISRRLVEGDINSIKVCRLSEIVDLSEVKCLLLKCDTEGAEFSILADVLPHLPERTFMFIEVHEGESAVYRLTHILGEAGFAVKEMHGKGLARDCIAVRGPNSLANVANL